MSSTRNKQRTYARNREFSRKGYVKAIESDGRYFLKLVIVVILGTLWIKFREPFFIAGVIPVLGLPIGTLLGLLLVNKVEKYQFDRKIWYAVLILVTIICFFLPAGIIL